MRLSTIALIGFMAVIGSVTVGGCTNDSDSTRALQSAGFSNIRTTGYRMWGCGESDTYHTGFVATNPAGQEVSGVVCCGTFKGCTIRF
jgi:hypothetical protein